MKFDANDHTYVLCCKDIEDALKKGIVRRGSVEAALATQPRSRERKDHRIRGNGCRGIPEDFSDDGGE